jgi:hypothetical protein
MSFRCCTGRQAGGGSCSRSSHGITATFGQRIRSPRNRFLAAGNALLGRLRLSLDRYDVPVWLDAPLQELRRDPVSWPCDRARSCDTTVRADGSRRGSV